MLPSYQAVADRFTQMHGEIQWATHPKKPTRRGLTALTVEMYREYLALFHQEKDEWWMLWESDRSAYHFLLGQFNIRLAADTFKQDKARVRFLLRNPHTRRSHPEGHKAWAWASS